MSCTRFTAIPSTRFAVAGRTAPSNVPALPRSPISKPRLDREHRSETERFAPDVQRWNAMKNNDIMI